MVLNINFPSLATSVRSTDEFGSFRVAQHSSTTTYANKFGSGPYLEAIALLLVTWMTTCVVNANPDYENSGAQYKCDARSSTMSFAEYDEGSTYARPSCPGIRFFQ